MEKHLGQGSKKAPEAGASVSMEPGGPSLLHGEVLTSPETLGGFMEVPILRHDRLITLLAIGNQFDLQSFSPPGRSGVGLKVPTLP